jgi:transcription antitermination factor NusG
MNWYALHCRANTEKVIGLRLADDGIESYYPHLVIRARHGKRETEKKFFPGYLFARFDLEHRLPISRLSQVVGILGWRNDPVAIPEHELAAVRTMVTHSVKVPTICPYVAEGDKVTVIRGPLQNLTGYVVYSKNAARVVVSVQMLARSICAEVDIDTLALVEKAKAA